ncbi:hypothetical protein KP79_PYT12428 [Mizuhopecten yessoensis]|uniref:Uncharacterized protein n=1 Tax=Mizuhopecten yessoensis TaxID=6573 RepID=A0A210QJN9_MIZYE|nr:hypothetical protein KP79_PYT12428 [Mizuhopecten yessoensis]
MSYIGLALQLLTCCCKLVEHYQKRNAEDDAAVPSSNMPASSRVHPLDQETNGENPPTLFESPTEPTDGERY